LIVASSGALAQGGGVGSTYDDYGSFATDPVELDSEAEQLFGRFFQNSFLLGTGILSGDLGAAYAAGVNAGMRFVFYFDKIWGAELGIGFGRHNGIYSKDNTGKTNIDLQLAQTLVPLSLGLRYGFDRDVLPRGFAAMNPYLAVAGEVFFRSERVVGTPTVQDLATSIRDKYSTDAVINDQAFGVAIGGGFEFDVYRRKLFMGLDFRYHLPFWADATRSFGNLSRDGQYLSILGMATYSY